MAKPNQSFNVYGLIDQSTELQLGTNFTIMIPMACSLDLNVTTLSYRDQLTTLNFETSSSLPFRMIDIVVPHDASVAYYATATQVIFPSGSRFAVFKTELNKTWYLWGNYHKIETCLLLYIGII